jgi:hypothetical protein
MSTVASGIAIDQPALSAYGKARSTIYGAPLIADELRKTDAYWRACNYLSLGMIYLLDNPLLREPLRSEPVRRVLFRSVQNASKCVNWTNSRTQPDTNLPKQRGRPTVCARADNILTVNGLLHPRMQI